MLIIEILMRCAISIFAYFLFAGVGYTIFYVWKYNSWFSKKIQPTMPDNAHIRHEISWSLLSRVLFAVIAVFVLQFTGYTALYFNVSEHGWGYLVGSTIFVIFLHDTYFYWIHRWMHHPYFYRTMHRVHHHSTNPTPWAAFSFHPTEAIVEAGIFPIIVVLMPLHPFALVGVLIFQFVFNIYGHSGFELAPRWWVKNPIFKYINTSVHHNYHHKEFNYNFGLYFNYWDRWMGTMDPMYEEKFYKVKSREVKPVEVSST